jgi:hypothetical protein
MEIDRPNSIIFFFVWLLIAMHLCTVGDASRRIFDTMIVSENGHTFDCLIKPEETWMSIEHIGLNRKASDFSEIHQYCRRSTWSTIHQIFSVENSIETNHRTFTFDQLRSMNVTYQQLYEWYAPTDIIEEYIAGRQTGVFVNCSGTMSFGSKCEYTFNSDEPFMAEVNKQFKAKDFVPNNLSLYTNGTCYEMNDTGCESVICLDWREICDGKNLF